MREEEEQRKAILSAIGMAAVGIKKILSGVSRADYIDALLGTLCVVFGLPPKELDEIRSTWKTIPEDSTTKEEFVISLNDQIGLDVFSATFSPLPEEIGNKNIAKNDLDQVKEALHVITSIDFNLKFFLKMFPNPDDPDISIIDEGLWFDFKLQLSLFQEFHESIGDEKLIMALTNDIGPKSEGSNFGDKSLGEINSGDLVLVALAPGIFYSTAGKNILIPASGNNSEILDTVFKEGTKSNLLQMDLDTANDSLRKLYDRIQINLLKERK